MEEDNIEEIPLSEAMGRQDWNTDTDVVFHDPPAWDLTIDIDLSEVALVQNLDDFVTWIGQQEAFSGMDLDDAIAQFMSDDPRAEFMPDFIRRQLSEELGL